MAGGTAPIECGCVLFEWRGTGIVIVVARNWYPGERVNELDCRLVAKARHGRGPRNSVAYREVSVQLSCRRNVREISGCGGQSVLMLVRREGEQSVPSDRASKRATILILVQRILCSAGCGGSDWSAGREEVRRIDVIISDEFKRGAMILVGPGAGNHVHQATAMLSILGTQGCGLYTELAYRIGKGEREITVTHVVIVVATVQFPLRGVAHAARYRDGDGRIGVLAACEVASRR